LLFVSSHPPFGLFVIFKDPSAIFSGAGRVNGHDAGIAKTRRFVKGGTKVFDATVGFSIILPCLAGTMDKGQAAFGSQRRLTTFLVSLSAFCATGISFLDPNVAGRGGGNIHGALTFPSCRLMRKLVVLVEKLVDKWRY
jgi:hypothetical protein